MANHMPDWLTLYHRSPYLLRSIAASAHGYSLRRWRYGAQTQALIEQALAREGWSAAEWQRWQEERLAFILERAAARVPFYRQQWQQRRRQGDRAAAHYLENWPVLEKETLRQNPRLFLADDCDPRRMFADHTSGTSGTPLTVWLSRQAVQTWYAWFEARWRRWYGVSRFDRWGILGGQLVTPAWQDRPPFWVWNAGLNQLYLSSYHLAPANIPAYLEAIRRYRLVYLWGYTSSLYALAHEALRLGERLPLRVAISNAEPVYPHQRQAIEAAFTCPLRETYGLSEAVVAASECQAGRLHLWPEAGLVEVFDGDQPAPPGAVGDLVCTGLFNADMPLIRYRVGDRGALAPPDERCACGRTLPLLASLEGRCDDVLLTRDGRRIGRLDPVFKADMPIVEAQIIQETLDRVRIRYVPADGYTPQVGELMAERLRQRMGAVEVALEAVEQVPRQPNGKFRAVISLLAGGASQGGLRDGN